jgi:putative transposase
MSAQPQRSSNKHNCKNQQRKRPIPKKQENHLASTERGVEEDSSDLTSDVAEKSLRMDQLNEEQLKIYSENCWLVSLITNGVSPRAALKRLGINRSERSVRDLMRRYKENGRRGLFDQRWFRSPEPNVLTSLVKKLLLALYFAWPAAGARAIWKELRRECLKRKLEEPSESTVRKFLDSLPEAYKMFRRGKVGVRNWEQTAAPVVRYENTQFANERWQGDHSPTKIWVRAKVDGEWKPFRTYISVVLDAHSRSIAGFIISIKYPDAWTIALLFYRAIMPKKRKTWRNRGIPFVFQSDRGKDFLSHAIAATLGKLKTVLDPDPPYYPNRKGKIERFFQTLDSGCLRLLPGHMDATGVTEGAAVKRVHEFITLQQLNAEIERWIDEDYHQRVHSSTGRKPAELWEETVRLRMPESEDDLNLLLLKHDKERNVKNTGIHISIQGVNHIYWSPELMYHFRRRVRIAYNPEDFESVLVYCAATNKFICEAFNMRSENPRYTVQDLLECRSQFRRGMKERIKDYMDEVYREDRRIARIDEWKEARQQALEAQEAEERGESNDIESLEDDADIRSLLEKFRRRDRGED